MAGAEGGGPGGVVEVGVALPGCERPIVILRRDLETAEDFVDPDFFDPGYSVAASTGHVMWEGSWALIRLLRDEPAGALCECLRGRRVVELGAGTGLLGLCMAARGAHVLLTDVQPVVEGTLKGNVARNSGGGWRAVTELRRRLARVGAGWERCPSVKAAHALPRWIGTSLSGSSARGVTTPVWQRSW